MAEKTVVREAKIAGQHFVLRDRDVVRAMHSVDPEPIASHFVVVGGRRFPPKQVVGAVTGLDRADFTTHQARRTLIRLGFSAGRRGTASSPHLPAGGGVAAERLADRLRSFSGEWVAIKDDEVIASSESPQRLVGWLGQHGQTAQSMFRVPEDQVASSGLAPL